MFGYLIILSFFIGEFSDTPVPSQDETWYVWIDTQANIDGKNKRLVSRAPFTITCCVKSGKYSRLEKETRKWIKKNFDPDFNDTALKNIQDESLALLVIEKAVHDSKENDSIIIVDYSRECK